MRKPRCHNLGEGKHVVYIPENTSKEFLFAGHIVVHKNVVFYDSAGSDILLDAEDLAFLIEKMRKLQA